MGDYYDGSAFRPDEPFEYNGNKAGWSLHQSRSAPFAKHSPEWKDIEGQYKMHDYYDGSEMRPEDPFLYNGGKAGWGPAELGSLHQR